MECKKCGTQNQDGAKFCAGCGADLSIQNAGEGLDMNAQQQAPNYGYAPQQGQPQNPNYGYAPQQGQPQNPNYGYAPQQGQPQAPNYGYAPQQPGQPKPVAPAQGLAIAALVLGIVSFFCLPIVTGTLGIVFGGMAKGKGNRSGMATAGIVCGAIGVGLWLIMLILGFSFMPF